MTPFRKVFRLPPPERRLVVGAMCLLALIRLGLWVFSVRSLHALVARRARRHESTSSVRHHSVERIVWAVRAAAAYVPGATCLPQALTAHALLTGHGYSSQVHIGMVMAERDVVAGHAWVESDGCVVLGGDVARYVPVSVFDGNRLGSA